MDQIEEQKQEGQLVLYINGQLDYSQSGYLWQRIKLRLSDSEVDHLVCDLGNTIFIDTAGIALLRNIEIDCANQNINLIFRNLPERVEHFLGQGQNQLVSEGKERQSGHPGLITRPGQWNRDKLSIIYNLICFLGNFIVSCLFILRHPRQIRFHDLLFHLQKIGSEAVLLICTINALTGMVVVFQGETVASTFGAPIYVADMVARSVTGQMSPVLTAILIAGRTGTSFAANIGTMKVRQELDVLAVMNFDVFTFLVIPRLLAISLAAPLLTMLANASGIIAGMITCQVFMNLSAQAFLKNVQATLTMTDIYAGLIKGFVFGLIIGLTGCFHGLQTEKTADSVGHRTTAAVVSSIFIIILVDTVFAALFNKMGW